MTPRYIVRVKALAAGCTVVKYQYVYGSNWRPIYRYTDVFTKYFYDIRTGDTVWSVSKKTSTFAGSRLLKRSKQPKAGKLWHSQVVRAMGWFQVYPDPLP